MLGYVKAYKPEMKIKDYELYKGIYCSLCRSLGRLYSPIAQLFLSYDFAFAAVLRLAVSKNGCSFSKKRCPYNPSKKCMICGSKNEIDFCAHAVIITVFYKIKDNLHDRGLKSKILALIIYPIIYIMYKKAVRLAPEIEEIIASSMKRQAEVEKKNGVCLDEAAHNSADALGKVVSLGHEGETKNSLYMLGYMVGRYVYILDAADDIESDIKKGNFNPLKNEFKEKSSENFAETVRRMLNLTQSSALEALDSAEKNRFEDILENIVLEGLESSCDNILKKYEPVKAKNKIYRVE